MGDVRLKMHDGTFRTLTAVRYVPELKRNLISLGELDRSGYKFKSEGEVVKINKGSLVCMKAVLRHGIYFLQATTLCDEAASVSSNSHDKARMWYLRMSHISEQGLKELAKQGILELG